MSETLKKQVARQLNARIYSFSQAEYLKMNRRADGSMRRKHRPYTIPQEAINLTKLLGRVEDATAEELEQFSAIATGHKEYML